MTKMNEISMEQSIGNQFVHDKGKNFKGKLYEDVQTEFGLNTFISAATRRGSNIP